jgi:hypothetical protein
MSCKEKSTNYIRYIRSNGSRDNTVDYLGFLAWESGELAIVKTKDELWVMPLGWKSRSLSGWTSPPPSGCNPISGDTDAPVALFVARAGARRPNCQPRRGIGTAASASPNRVSIQLFYFFMYFLFFIPI